MKNKWKIYWWLSVTWIVAACDGLSGSEATEGFGPVWELPWPTQEALLECESHDGKMEMPVLSAGTGLVQLDVSSELIPVGVAEALEITILDPETGLEDGTANGEVRIDSDLLDSASTVIPIENGKGAHVLQFSQTGETTIQARFTGQVGKDERQGSREVMVYESRLPLYEMTISDEDWETLMGNLEERIKVPVVLTVDGVDYESQVRIHGASSRSYPKKSFRFDLENDLQLPDTHDHIILRSEWNDKSLLRNYLGLEVFRNGTWLPTPQAEMAHFRVNQRYYGVMWRVERIGGDFLRLRGMNKDTCSMYEADPSGSCWIPGGDLTPLSDFVTYMCVYDLKKGPLEYDDLIDFIENTLQLEDTAFGETIGSVLDLDAYFVYLSTMAIIGNRDHIKKNYYLYRDPDSADDRWIFFPWDLELTFGHIWTEENDVLDEDLYWDMSPEFTDFNNQLIEKLFVHPRFLVRYYEVMAHILEHTFTWDFIKGRIDSALCRGMPDILADTQKRASQDEYLLRVDELETFVEKRRAYLLEAM